MTTYSQFCPVAKAAEVFGDRWSPIIIRELCFGTRSFGQLLEAARPISRTVLAQRLKQIEQFAVVRIEPKPSGKGHLYRLTSAGEEFRSIIELLAYGANAGDKACSGRMILIHKHVCGAGVDRSTQQKSRRKVSLSALTFVVCPNPIAARATGG
jgi:DNA-binding HxlR family transcriptional regulator